MLKAKFGLDADPSFTVTGFHISGCSTHNGQEIPFLPKGEVNRFITWQRRHKRSGITLDWCGDFLVMADPNGDKAKIMPITLIDGKGARQTVWDVSCGLSWKNRLT